MMRFLHKISDSFFKQRRFGSSILRVSVYSTQTEPNSSDTLYQRLQRCNEQRVSVIPVLDKWVAEGGEIHHQQLIKFIINFRKTRRFEPALEIAEWMSHSLKGFAISPGHVAVQLDLIAKVHGVEQAEKYFNSLDDSSIDFPVYGALLNCYAATKSLEKAEATMDKIRKMNSCRTLDYNTMLSLYSQMGMLEKLFSLVQEMEDKGIEFNKITYNIRLNAYADSDLEGMGKLLMKMELDPLVKVDYSNYTTAARGYIRAGALEKASVVLKKAEHLIKGQQTKFTYGMLITLYAAMQKKEDVYRLWDLLPKDGKLHNMYYVSMITSLEKLDDLDGAKKVMEEWGKKTKNFDIRIPNLVISAYCKKGRVGEAEIILKRVIETGMEPTASTWDRMAFGYCKNGEMEKAIEMMKKAFLATFPGWKPDLSTVAACLEYVNKKGDGDGIQEMLMLLEKCGSVSVDFKESIRRYLSNGEQMPEALELRSEATQCKLL